MRVHGDGIIATALAVRSPGNRINGLQFAGFSGPEVVLVETWPGGANIFDDCLFGGDGPDESNGGVGLRIVGATSNPGDVGTVTVLRSRFVANEGAISLEGAPGGTLVTLRVSRSWIGTSADGGPGTGNLFAVTATFGTVELVGNRLSGPGDGIDLGPGTDGSRVAGNEIGLSDPAGAACAGFYGPAVRVGGAVTVIGNRIRCSGIGVAVTLEGARARVTSNVIGGGAGDGMLEDGVRFAAAPGVKIDRNRISGSGGAGIARDPASPGPTDQAPEVLCNRAWSNAGGALDLGSPVPSPILGTATPIEVDGTTDPPLTGWVEIFGDEQDQARLFLGAVEPSADGKFRQLIPVVDLRVRPAADGTNHAISFDRSLLGFHTATSFDPGLGGTSDPSVPLAADNQGLAFDVVRGEVANLGPDPAGGTFLGDLVCLAAAVPPGGPEVVDPDVPLPGSAFFYLARRRSGPDLKGTYDPAQCADVAGRAFRGPRRPGNGDCL
ncbi:MAG: right-handed parallel beta-helix repeat-containing protein [Acidobacteria bacterium]|nr:MAG: right-handed parallel beta-helix repeat-containing protein [Acidobacteriota bacterium]